jgi:hypothetical protein
MRRTVITALVACLLGAATVGAVGSAATSKKKSSTRKAQTAQTTTTPSGPPPTLKEDQATRDAARAASQKKIADALSVSAADLQAALDGVRDDQLAADVTANRLTQAEADAIKACAAAPLTCDRSNLPAGGPGGDRHGGGKPGDDDTAFYDAVAKKLNKSSADVKKAFEANRPVRPAGGPGDHDGPGHGHGGPDGPDGPGGPGPGTGAGTYP